MGKIILSTVCGPGRIVSSSKPFRVACLLLACGGAGVMSGCSTFVSPEGGLGASLTLATVGHVSERETALRQSLKASLEQRVAAEVEAARAEDEERIETLRAELAQRDEELTEVAAALSRSESKVADLAEILRLGIEGLAEDAARTRATTDRLDYEIKRIPHEALRQLSRAIDGHLVSHPLPDVPPPTAVEPVARRPAASLPIERATDASRRSVEPPTRATP